MKPKVNFLFAEQTFGSHMFVCTLTLPGQNPDADLSENRTGSVCKNLPIVECEDAKNVKSLNFRSSSDDVGAIFLSRDRLNLKLVRFRSNFDIEFEREGGGGGGRSHLIFFVFLVLAELVARASHQSAHNAILI